MAEEEGEGKRIRALWGQAEDEALLRLVRIHGPRNWSMISKGVPGRSGKSCRMRWYNQLSPAVEHRPFTAEEDEAIIRAHFQLGNRWSAISRLLIGRTDNAAGAQELVAGARMVDVSHAVTESGREVAAMEEGVVGAKEAMGRVLERADHLRLETIKGVVGILRPRQAVQFLAAGSKLLLRVHEFGKVVGAAAAAVAD